MSTPYAYNAATADAHPQAVRLEQAVVSILWPQDCEAQYPHAHQLLDQALALTPERHAYRVTLFKRRGKLYREQERFGEALAVLNEALALAEGELGLVHPDTRRIRAKVVRVHDRMIFRPSVTEADQEENRRLAGQCFLDSRQRALDARQPAIAAVLLADLAGLAQHFWHCSSPEQQPQRHKQACDLTAQAVQELVEHRATLPEDLRSEPGRTAFGLGHLYETGYQLAHALDAFRLAARLLPPGHWMHQRLPGRISWCYDQLYPLDEQEPDVDEERHRRVFRR